MVGGQLTALALQEGWTLTLTSMLLLFERRVLAVVIRPAVSRTCLVYSSNGRARGGGGTEGLAGGSTRLPLRPSLSSVIVVLRGATTEPAVRAR